jgi:hypothetical protein
VALLGLLAAPSESGQAPAVQPAARRLCDVLHTRPAQRRNECCGGGAGSLAGVCIQELSQALSAKAVNVEGAALEACAAQTEAALQGCDWLARPVPALAACQGVIRGRLEAGAPCLSSLACPVGLFCRGAAPGTPGVCSPPAKAGGLCPAPVDNLATFTRLREDPRHPICDGVCIKGRCLAAIPQGGTCSLSAQCAAGLACLDRHCASAPAPRQIGEACSAQLRCVDGGHCAGDVCVPQKGGGESCKAGVECLTLDCRKEPGADEGRCSSPCASRATPGLDR